MTATKEAIFGVDSEVHGLEDLKAWWLSIAGADLDVTLPKAIEYSSSDLLAIGSQIRPRGTDGQRVEAAIAFYLMGKCARILGVIQEGGSASDDSWKDVTVYSMMGRFAREFGRWP